MPGLPEFQRESSRPPCNASRATAARRGRRGGTRDALCWAPEFPTPGAHEKAQRRRQERSFEPAFARAQGEEVSLTGGAGDGYCFDTNAIHAGSLDGRKARYVVVMEFHSGIIEDAFSRHGLHFRSPFGLR